MNMRPKCIFLDIDGTIILHHGSTSRQVMDSVIVLNKTVDKLSEWDRKGYYIILTTGRKESLRKKTEKQLSREGIFYDQLIMGIGGGTRVLINDLKPDSEFPTAVAINLQRNKGIGDVEV